MATLLLSLLCSSTVFANLFLILPSALNALMILRPPRVSSTCDMVSLHLLWASRESLLSLLPSAPIPQAIAGTTAIVKSVSCQLVKSRVPK